MADPAFGLDHGPTYPPYPPSTKNPYPALGTSSPNSAPNCIEPMLWFNEIKLPRGRRGKARNMIKKTRWSLSVSVMPSQAMVDMPWPRPHTPHLHEFKARAERYRRRRRIGLGLMIGFMVVGVLMMSLSRYLPEEAPIWGGGLMAAAWLFTLLIIFLFGLRLRCPACKKRLEP